MFLLLWWAAQYHSTLLVISVLAIRSEFMIYYAIGLPVHDLLACLIDIEIYIPKRIFSECFPRMKFGNEK